MRNVYRIEHRKDKMGIFFRYSDDNLRLDNLGLGSAVKRHNKFNTPQNDGLDLEKNNQEWFCAYKSKSQLLNWFSKKELRNIIEVGYNILKLKVEEYQVGQDQIIFTKRGMVKQTNITKDFLKPKKELNN